MHYPAPRRARFQQYDVLVALERPDCLFSRSGLVYWARMASSCHICFTRLATLKQLCLVVGLQHCPLAFFVLLCLRDSEVGVVQSASKWFTCLLSLHSLPVDSKPAP